MSQSKRLKLPNPSEKKDVEEFVPPFEGKRKQSSGGKGSLLSPSKEKKPSDSGNIEYDPFEEEGRRFFGAAYSPKLYRKNTGFFADSSSIKKFPDSLWQHCLTPSATEEGQSIFKLESWRPLTDKEKKEKGFYNNTHFFTKPKDRELLRKHFQNPRPAPPTAVSVTQQEKLEQNEDPYCKCGPHSSCNSASKLLVSSLPEGASEEHREDFIPIWIEYKRQVRQNCFDIDVHPGPSFAAAVLPVEPLKDFNGKGELFKELANSALEEYSKEDCNNAKYKVKKIEKVVFTMLGTLKNYWMTVRVLNLSLHTPIETFQIHASLNWKGERTIFCCRLKEEVEVGVPCCNFCFGKLPKSKAGKEAEE